MTIVFYETTANTDALGATEAIRWSSQGYNHPSSPGYFDERLKESFSTRIRRSIYPNRLGFGFGSEDLGIVTAANADGALDALTNYGYGNEATIKLGDSLDENYATLTTVVKGRATRALATATDCRIGWKSRDSALDVPISGATFAGTNSGSTGLEGTVDDIKGQYKPRAGGGRQIIEPVLVNGPTRVLAWNYDKDGDRENTDTVHGVLLSGAEWDPWTSDHASGDYVDAAALAAASPTVGYYATCKAESLVKMGGSVPLSGGVRADVTVHATASDAYASNLVKALLEEMGETSSTIDESSFTALATARPYAAAYYVREESYRGVINILLQSVIGWAALTHDGKYRCGTVPDFTETALASFRRFELGVAAKLSDYDIVSLEPVLNGGEEGDNNAGAPVKQVTVRYGRIAAPYDFNSIASAVEDATKQKLSQEWRSTAPVSNSSTAAQFGEAIEVELDSWLVESAHASAIGTALLVFLANLRLRFLLRTRLTPSLVSAVGVGSMVQIDHARFGFSAGKKGWIVGVDTDTALRSAVFEIII